ncbi:MAG: sugar transferase [Bacteroidetes bacterium]|nr:sugar transferase [Bacteroidota bacterium]
MKRDNYRIFFILSDLIASGFAWSLFFIYRKLFVETIKYGIQVPLEPDLKFFLGLFIIPLSWFVLYYATGSYSDIRRKSSLSNFLQLLIVNLLGTFIIFFALILDDTVISYLNYYTSFLVLFLIQFTFTFLFRSIILSLKDRKFKTGKDAFRVLVIGEKEKQLDFINKHQSWITEGHFRIIYGIDPNLEQSKGFQLNYPVEYLEHLEDILSKHEIEEVFILTDPDKGELIESLLMRLFREDVYIRISTELYPLIKIPVKSSEIFNSPLLLLSKDLLRGWQQSLKTLFDIFVSFFAIMLLSPLIIFLALAVKMTSQGPVIYSHERVGKNGRPFRILKFRSMYQDSEPDGPQLATRSDKRITPVGKFMRKRRLDEIPNFINVLKGDMSLVGPRPERKFFIDQIIQVAPQYAKLHLVKPGITSWGQVKYGYAENTSEMIKRMRYDLVYTENMSFYVDLQILFRTIKTVLKGKGI